MAQPSDPRLLRLREELAALDARRAARAMSQAEYARAREHILRTGALKGYVDRPTILREGLKEIKARRGTGGLAPEDIDYQRALLLKTGELPKATVRHPDNELAEAQERFGDTGPAPGDYARAGASVLLSPFGAVVLIVLIFVGIGLWTGGDQASAYDHCVQNGVAYFEAIGSYPFLSDGRDAVDVATKRCRSNTGAFDAYDPNEDYGGPQWPRR